MTNVDAWTRLKGRIGMPPVYLTRYSAMGADKVARSFEDLLLYGLAVVPKFEANDIVIERRIGFREWSARVRETYGC